MSLKHLAVNGKPQWLKGDYWIGTSPMERAKYKHV